MPVRLRSKIQALPRCVERVIAHEIFIELDRRVCSPISFFAAVTPEYLIRVDVPAHAGRDVAGHFVVATSEHLSVLQKA
jgi:hypothetical protein